MQEILDAERALIGCVLGDNGQLDGTELVEADFLSPIHAAVWNNMGEMSGLGEGIDLVTLATRMPLHGAYLNDCLNLCNVPSQFTAYQRIIKDAAIMRRLKALGSEMSVWDGPASSRIEEAESRVLAIGAVHTTRGFVQIESPLVDHVEAVKAQVLHGKPRGIMSGFAAIDNKTLGFNPGQSIILAARPGVGKTTLALNMAANMTRIAGPVGFLSLEMGVSELMQRMVCAEAGIDSGAVRSGQLGKDQFHAYEQAAEKLKRLPLHISDDAGVSLAGLKNQARALVRKRGIKALFIDYLQLLRIEGRASLYESTTMISREIKLLAKSLEIPVITLSQLSRASEQDGKRAPRLSDLRDSGAIEQDADVVLFLHRPEWTEPATEAHVAKNRDGATGQGELRFEGQYSRFENCVF